jgi:hypothetical protein
MRLMLRCATLTFLMGTSAIAAGPAETPGSVLATLSVNPDKCIVYGTALDTNATPLQNARVNLRNLHTRTVEQTSTTNTKGEYVFVALPDTPYVVEVADRPGRIVAVGDVVLSRAGDIVGGIIVVPPMAEAAGLFRSTLGTVVSAIAGTGLTVLQATAPPLSPEQ